MGAFIDEVDEDDDIVVVSVVDGEMATFKELSSLDRAPGIVVGADGNVSFNPMKL